ncbi:hypothetical protein ACIBP6_24970 [Nonomuraea terrae]|uniref:hypothetical protein n=1 Tax=Nonomuraea terrae TaxID=2530383 RepID=UPI00379056A3
MTPGLGRVRRRPRISSPWTPTPPLRPAGDEVIGGTLRVVSVGFTIGDGRIARADLRYA